MGQSVTRWVADDGTEFTTYEDMVEHELLMLDRKMIDLFLDHVVKTSPRRRSEYQRLLERWQSFFRKYELQGLSAQVNTVDNQIPQLRVSALALQSAKTDLEALTNTGETAGDTS